MALLASENVDYIIVGGYAVAYHGAPRFTGDIDFFVRPDTETGTKLIGLLQQFVSATCSLHRLTLRYPIV